MGVFRILKCECGKQSFKAAPGKKEACPRCGKEMRMLPSFYVSYRANGKRVIEAVGATKKLAERVLAKRVGQVREEGYFGKQSITWDKAAGLLVAWAENNVSAKTQGMYSNSLKVLSRAFHGKKLADITVSMIEQFKMARGASATSSTINRDLSTLRKVFELAVDAGEISASKLAKVRGLKENPSRERILSEEEYERLMEECSKNRRLFLAVSIALQTGLRKHGVYTLSWDDVSFEHHFIRKVVKGGKSIAFPMTDSLYDLLRAEKEKGLSPYVIPSPERSSEHVSLNSNLGFPEACKRADIDNFRFHDLRHTFATLFVMKTNDKESCRAILGHSKSSTTDRYVNVPDSHIIESMKKFEERR